MTAMPASAATRQQTAERRAQVLRLRASGLGYEEIARRLGHKTAAAACQDAARALKDRQALLDVEAAWFTALEMERLETLQRTMEIALRTAASEGDTSALVRVADRLLGISARRSKLLGLDAEPGARGGAEPDFVDELQSRRDAKRASVA
jgi:transcriptional regulator